MSENMEDIKTTLTLRVHNYMTIFPRLYNTSDFNALSCHPNHNLNQTNNSNSNNNTPMDEAGPSSLTEAAKNAKRTAITGKIIRVDGDGSCLFRSLVICLCPDLQKVQRDDFGCPTTKTDASYETEMADSLRAKVVGLMSQNIHFYGQLESTVLNADQPLPTGYSHFHDRLTDMTLTSTMPGDLELNATSIALERQVLVVDVDLKPIVAYGRDYFPQSECLVVRYTSLGTDVGHYDCVLHDKESLLAMDAGIHVELQPQGKVKCDAQGKKTTNPCRYDCFGHPMRIKMGTPLCQTIKDETFDKSIQVSPNISQLFAQRPQMSCAMAHATHSKQFQMAGLEVDVSNNKNIDSDGASTSSQSNTNNSKDQSKNSKNSADKNCQISSDKSTNKDVTNNKSSQNDKATLTETTNHTATTSGPVSYSDAKTQVSATRSASDMDFSMLGDNSEALLFMAIGETDKNNCRKTKEEQGTKTEVKKVATSSNNRRVVRKARRIVKTAAKTVAKNRNNSKVKKIVSKGITKKEEKGTATQASKNALQQTDTKQQDKNTNKASVSKAKKRVRSKTPVRKQQQTETATKTTEDKQVATNSNHVQVSQSHDDLDPIDSYICDNNTMFVPQINIQQQKCFICKKRIFRLLDKLSCALCGRIAHRTCVPGLKDQVRENASLFYCYYCSSDINPRSG